ncbi:unnamed protein product [Rotaria sp. Silwood1]|nr:unnamed protein product [Rotaria sp. Silwood1]CAF1632049.1 unnamed protein product [Rotaria sp. Silwood1]CAF3810896.1 unnamed protein product [Rotaria sp. Silwood1]CAF5011610.1 unnamed protein product [Rotaria sp. Silwood1]
MGNFGNILQGRLMNSSSGRFWQWRNLTGDMGFGIAGITVANDYENIAIGLMSKSGLLSSNGHSFSILATDLNSCHYVVILPTKNIMLYTDAHQHIYQVDLITKKQTILLDHVGGSAGTRGLIYDSINNWIYFSGVQLMRSRPDGAELQNITQYLNLNNKKLGFQIALDNHFDPTNPRVYLAFDGGLYMAYADGSQEKLVYSSSAETNFVGPYGVAIGVDPSDNKRYIFWCRGRRSEEAYLERSILDNDGQLTTIESLWNDSSTKAGQWLYALALVPWKFQ